MHLNLDWSHTHSFKESISIQIYAIWGNISGNSWWCNACEPRGHKVILSVSQLGWTFSSRKCTNPDEHTGWIPSKSAFLHRTVHSSRSSIWVWEGRWFGERIGEISFSCTTCPDLPSLGPYCPWWSQIHFGLHLKSCFHYHEPFWTELFWQL